jgi:hypothetical protein
MAALFREGGHCRVLALAFLQSTVSICDIRYCQFADETHLNFPQQNLTGDGRHPGQRGLVAFRQCPLFICDMADCRNALLGCCSPGLQQGGDGFAVGLTFGGLHDGADQGTHGLLLAGNVLGPCVWLSGDCGVHSAL